MMRTSLRYEQHRRALSVPLLAAIAAASIVGFGCGGGGGTDGPVTPAQAAPVVQVPAVAQVQWSDVGEVVACCNYLGAAFHDGELVIYSNTNGSDNGDLWRWYHGPTRVFRITEPRDAYIRTLGVARIADGGYVALLYTGDGYPTSGGYSPSIATSPDGIAWTFRGFVSPYGRNMSSNGAIVADANGCEAWVDNVGKRLARMTAPLPCVTWTADGKEHWPSALPDDWPQFCSAARTPYGTHMICSLGLDARLWRHLFRPNGATAFCVIESEAKVWNNEGKGITLAYNDRDNTLHAIASGRHLSAAARAYVC